MSCFSQGGRSSFYIGMKKPGLFRAIMPIGGVYMDALLDKHIEEAKTLKIDIFHGDKGNVNSFSSMKAAYQKLLKMGFDVSLTTYPLGHTYDATVLSRILARVK